MVIFWIFLIVKMFDDDIGLDFSVVFYGFIILVSVFIYGGIVWW